MVPLAGLEPARPKATDFESVVSTNSTTGAKQKFGNLYRACSFCSPVLILIAVSISQTNILPSPILPVFAVSDIVSITLSSPPDLSLLLHEIFESMLVGHANFQDDNCPQGHINSSA